MVPEPKADVATIKQCVKWFCAEVAMLHGPYEPRYHYAARTAGTACTLQRQWMALNFGTCLQERHSCQAKYGITDCTD